MPRKLLAKKLISDLAEIASQADVLSNDPILDALLRRSILRIANAGHLSAQELVAVTEHRLLN